MPSIWKLVYKQVYTLVMHCESAQEIQEEFVSTQEKAYLDLSNIRVGCAETRSDLYARFHPKMRDAQNKEKLSSMILETTSQGITACSKRIVDEFVACSGVQKSHRFEWIVNELLMNAARHGNKWESEKNVYITWGVHAGEFVVYMDDEGAGFDPTRIEDRSTPEFLEDTHGRGLLTSDRHLDKLNGHLLYLPMDQKSTHCREAMLRIPLASGKNGILASR